MPPEFAHGIRATSGKGRQVYKSLTFLGLPTTLELVLDGQAIA